MLSLHPSIQGKQNKAVTVTGVWMSHNMTPGTKRSYLILRNPRSQGKHIGPKKVKVWKHFFNRKVACAELSLDCSSSSSSATISPANSPKKEKRGARPKSLSITVNHHYHHNHNINNNNNNNIVKSPAESPDKDHHIHRYYSFLRSQHDSGKG